MPQDPNTPKYNTTTGLLTDYGRYTGAPEVNAPKAGAVTPPVVTPSTAPIGAPTPSTPGAGLDDASFLGVLNGMNVGFQQNNALVDQKNAVLDAAFGTLDPAKLAKLPPDIQHVIQGGNREQMLLQAQVLTDSINGKNASVASSIQYLTAGYEASQTRIQTEINNLMTFATNNGYQIGDLVKAMAPVLGKDVSAKLAENLTALGVSPYVKSSLTPNIMDGGGSTATDPVSNAMNAIVGNESGGNYQAISPAIVGGQYAGHKSYGKYQVLDVHIPDWTKQATGTSLTPEQFLADTAAQDAVAKWQIGKLWAQYGNIQDVASVWFTGVPAAQSSGMRDKATGMTAEQYIQKATEAYAKGAATQGGGSDYYNKAIQGYVDGLKSGVITSISGVPAAYRTATVIAADNQGIQTPQGERRQLLAAQAAVKNYIENPLYALTSSAFPYLLKIDASMRIPGSVPDQELLDSYTKLSTQGGVISDAQVNIILGGKSFADSIDVMGKKLASGGVLSDNQRQQIYDIGHAVYGNLIEGYQPIYDQASKNLVNGRFPEWVQSAVLPDLKTLSALSENAVGDTSISGGGSDANSQFDALYEQYGGN